MAIKALKQNISIRETQKMLHQWKAWGISDSATLKLLDLYLGMPNFMNAEGMYPVGNLYQICLALKTIHTSDILEYIKKCKSFELVWNENGTDLVAFFTPLWHQKSTDFVSATVSPAVSPAETKLKSDNSILYNNNLYPPEDSYKGSSSENSPGKPAEASSPTPGGTPFGEEVSQPSSAKEFFHRINANPEEKKRILVPLIDCIATRQNFTRPRALEALVILVNEILIPYFDSQPRFAKTSHIGRTIWLQNLMKTRHGDTLLQQAVQKFSKTLQEGLEKQRNKRREFRPVSPFEWKDTDKDARYYDDPIDGKAEIPGNAPPRPSDTAIWNVISCEWISISNLPQS